MALDMETDVDLPQGHNSLYPSHTCEVETEPSPTCWFTRAGFTHVYTINNSGEEKLRSLDMLSRCNWDSPVEEDRVGARAYLKARLCDERRYWDWLEYGTYHPKMWPLVNMIDAMEPPPAVLAERWTDDAKAFRIGKVIAKDMLDRALSKTVTRALEDMSKISTIPAGDMPITWLQRGYMSPLFWGALNAKARHWLKRRIKNRYTDTALITKLVDIALDRVQQHLKFSGLGHFNKATLRHALDHILPKNPRK